MKESLVSIVIPVHNVAAWLSNCLDSCINQTHQNIEIIAVNDGSTDNCKDIIANFIARDKRVKLIDKPNGGPNSARRAGIEAAKGDYITLVDGDDFLEPEAIEILLKNAKVHDPDIVVACANYCVNGTNEVVGQLTNKPGNYTGTEFVKLMLPTGPYSLWSKLYRRSLLQNGTVYPDFPAGQDVPLVIEWCLRAKKIISVENVVYNYVVSRPGSTTITNRKKRAEGVFDSIYFLFEQLKQSERINDIKKELVYFLTTRLYFYLRHPDNNIRTNKRKIRNIAVFIYANKEHLYGFQYNIVITLARMNVILAHWFVYIMQIIKPNLHYSFK